MKVRARKLVPGISRRRVLGLLGSSPLWALGLWPRFAGAAKVPTDRITVLYRRESPQAPTRLDDAVRYATLALEAEFLKRGFRVIQPSAEVSKLMDQGPAVVVTFADDAGFSLVFSAYKDLRPVPGQEAAVAEVRLQARVCVGRNILVAEEGRGQQFTRLEPATREFGERRAMELAARKAAAELAEKAADNLKALTAADLERMLTGATATTGAALPMPEGQAAPPPRPQAAATGGGAPEAPPGLGPASPAAPPGLPAAPPALAPAAPGGGTPMPTGQPLNAPRNRYALVVGVSDYSSVRAGGINITDLPGVARDAKLAVESLARMGYAPERTERLMDAKATSGAVRAAMKRFSAKVEPEDQLVIFISGHGGDKDFSASGYGMPILGDFRHNDENALDFWELQSMVKNLRGRVVWINDTCHSGGAATNVTSVVVSSSGVKANKDVRGPDADTVAKASGPGQDFAILTAARADEVSWEDGGGGLFTTRFFGAAQQHASKLALGTLFSEQVESAVIAKSREICSKQGTCKQQTPTMAFGGNGHLIRL